MEKNKFDLYVYAHWKGMQVPERVGVLSAHFAKGKKAFSFEYDAGWLRTGKVQLLDPDIHFFSGAQFPTDKENFGVFSDSMPDTLHLP